VRDIFPETEVASLIPPESSSELASVIRRVVTDPTTAAETAWTAKQFVSARFDWWRAAAGYDDLLLSLNGPG
jgi:hypothetical protein